MITKSKATKPPVIRKGQTQPYHKSTLAETDERIELARTLLSNGATRYTLHKAMREQYGVVWQTAERYMRRARELLLLEAGKDKAEARSDAIGFYTRQLMNVEASVMERIKARTRLDEIFGIDAPRRQEVSGPEGGHIKVEHKVKEGFDFEAYSKLCDSFFGPAPTNGAGEPVHPPRTNGTSGVILGANGN